MNPGQLDQRITLEQESRVPDDQGGAVSTWATLATVWAEVRPLSGRERAELASVQAPATYRFRIRRRADVTDTMRIGWNGGTYNIRFIADAGGRELYMTIDAERGVAQ